MHGGQTFEKTGLLTNDRFFRQIATCRYAPQKAPACAVEEEGITLEDHRRVVKGGVLVLDTTTLLSWRSHFVWSWCMSRLAVAALAPVETSSGSLS